MKDARERFTETAELYARWRPGYPDALLDWLARETPLRAGDAVADVGCGTGISTRLLAARGFDAVGVDPNEDMLAKARAAGGGARYARGEAAATGLPGAGFKLVCAAQAMHWFELEPALREFGRLLAPGGACAAFWNRRAESPFLDEYQALLDAHASEYRAIRSFDETIEALRRLVPGGLRESEFANSQSLDLEGLLGRVRSSSYVAHGLRRPEEFESALRELFRRHQRGGRVDFAYRCRAALWRPA